MHYIYEIKAPVITDFEAAAEFLETANKYECTSLKLYIESILAEELLSPTTAPHMLVLADCHSCPLLKEHAMKMYEKSPREFMASKHWAKIEESPQLMKELLMHMTLKPSASSGTSSNKRKLDERDVGSLRSLLQDHKMNLDGTREMLVKRLKPLYEPEEEAKDDGGHANAEENGE
ncbi:MAG: hypothetical protein SGARI_004506 [Bacillariaceae sp.]